MVEKPICVDHCWIFRPTLEVTDSEWFSNSSVSCRVVKSDVFARLAGISHSERRRLLGPVAEAILNCDLLRTDAVEMAKFFFSVQDVHARIMAEVGLTMPDQTSETGAAAAFLGSVSIPPAPGTSER